MTAPGVGVPGGGRAVFELRAGPYRSGELTVVSLRGREGLSRLYSFDVLALCSVDRAGIDAALLGETATLLFDLSDGEPRSLTGIIAEVSPEGTHPIFGAAAYRLRVVPRMWLLRRSKNSRIFQDLTVKDIVSRVLAGLRVPFEWRLRGALRPKAYCVQYQETDHDFVSRILAEEGIFYCFEPRPDAAEPWDAVVFYDAADYPSIDPHGDGTLLFRPEGGLSAAQRSITTFAPRRRVREGSVLLKDYDFQRPLLDLMSEAKSPEEEAPAHGLGADLPRYYHPVSDYEDPEVQADRAARLLSQLRRKAHVARGQSACPKLAPGRRFALAEHPNDAFNREHAVTRVEHEGRLPDRARGAASEGPVYRNTFECVPANIVYRPRRPVHTPRQVMETAIVVGPPNEVVYTDRLGRIKVQFHWDRDGLRNEHSSCWLRVSQAWAGPSWGFQFIPRIGMEVIVTFAGGDPDRPVVTGCLYNPLNPPSFDLPGSATKSGIRTRSVPGHDGHNELSFEDRLGQEKILLHAERDLDCVVKNDHAVTVGRFDPDSPSGDQKVRIARDQEVDVGANQVARVSGNQEQTILGDRRIMVQGGAYSQVSGPRFDRCDDSYAQTTEVNHQLNVGGDGTFFVSGNAAHTTGADRREEVFGLMSTRVGGYMECSVRGDYSLAAAMGISLTSAEGIRLVCGDSSIDLGPKEIVITSPTVTVAATGVAAIVAEGVSLHLEKEKAILSAKEKVEVHAKDSEVALDDSGVMAAARKDIKLFSKGASIVLDNNAAMDGLYVKLNCGGSFGMPEDKEPDELEVSWVEIELTQPVPKEGDPTQIERKPVPGARYIAEASNGRIYRGTLDGEGRARIAVPPGGVQVSFPDHDAGRVKPK
jgi:type VI secretion system secreted protein VgrG